MRVPPAMQSRRPVLDGLRVLVAEDDAEMRSVIVTTLLRDGAEVMEASSGLALFDRLRRCARNDDMPHLLISDVRMPGLTGLQVLQRMRERSWSLPVILITGFGDEDTHNAACDLGATAVFDKPFDLDDLRTAVLHFVRGSR